MATSTLELFERKGKSTEQILSYLQGGSGECKTKVSELHA